MVETFKNKDINVIIIEKKVFCLVWKNSNFNDKKTTGVLIHRHRTICYTL